jgi:signal transduction histidine kinase
MATDTLFAGAGEARARGRAVDWGATPLGPTARWPVALRTAVRLCLDSPAVMAVWAGPEFTLIHNEGYLPVLGAKAAWALGRPAREVWAEVWDTLALEFAAAAGGHAVRHEERHYRLQRGAREADAYFLYSLTPLRGDDGQVLGIFNVLDETTRGVLARAQQKEVLAFSLNAAGIGAWDLDLDSNTAQRSLDHDLIFGYGELLPEWSYDRFLAHVHPDDRAAVDARFQHAAATGGDWSFQCRIVRADGAERWIWAAGRHRLDDQGHRHMAGIVQDITERVRAQEALRRSEQHFRSLFDSIDEALCVIELVYDGDRAVDFRYVQVNPAFEKHTGLRDVVGRRGGELIPRVDPQWLQTYGHIAATGIAERFEDDSKGLGRIFDVYAFRFGPAADHRVAVLFTDITARRRAELALHESRARLEAADRRKDQFLAALSHELRNPLATVTNGLYILRQAEPGGAQAVRTLDTVERQVNHLTHLIDDLLDVTRIAKGKVQLRRERLELSVLAARVVEDLQPVLDKAGLEASFAAPAAPVMVNADAERMTQVLGNLLHNAAKFTPRGGHVRVSVAVDAPTHEAVLTVADTGAGMGGDTLAQIFEPFVQADLTLDRTRGGLGLGLALVKGLVEQHGGRVAAHSDGLGRGATFTVRLPVAAAEPTRS